MSRGYHLRPGLAPSSDASSVKLLQKPRWSSKLSELSRDTSRTTPAGPPPPPPPCRPSSPSSTSQSRVSRFDQYNTILKAPSGEGAMISTATEKKHRNIKLAVVGDVHESWDHLDDAMLSCLEVDVVVFVGDFANEDPSFVEKVVNGAEQAKKVVILGNHDAWYSLTEKGHQRAIRRAIASSLPQRVGFDAINEMLEALGKTHIGFSSLYFEDIGVSFVGGRPFSRGGKRWSDMKEFYQKYYEVASMEESAHRILDQILAQPDDVPIVVVAHNGPLGLGGFRHSPCGVDWKEPQHDFGDPDLQEALDAASKQGRPPSLVVFGHMHHSLKGGGLRDMTHIDGSTGTVYLNAAVVPRRKKFRHAGDEMYERIGHHFLLIDIKEGYVSSARNVWLTLSSQDAGTSISTIYEEELIKSSAAMDHSGDVVMSCFSSHSRQWNSVVVRAEAGLPVT